MSSNNQSVFKGTIIAVRAVEDCIRATKKYTEGVKTMWRKHPVQSVQGESFPSRKLLKHYEFYPEIDLDMTRPMWDAIFTTSDWLWGETPRIDVSFDYDYRCGRAIIIVPDGEKAVRELKKIVPGFSDSLAKVVANGQSGY